MAIRNKLLFLLGIVWLSSLAPAAARAEPPAQSERSIEASLLHRRIDLSGLHQWRRANGAWQPFTAPRNKLLIINIWSHTCRPCQKEFPMFQRMVAAWQGHPDISFLFVADPPDETTRADVENFWKSPVLELTPGERCTGIPSARGRTPTCVLELPQADPIRSQDKRLGKSLFEVPMRPLTLLVDRTGLIRQVFAGSVEERKNELSEAIARLKAAL